MARQQRARGTLHYDKPALSHAELLVRLRERGLQVPDTVRAERYLRHIGYYRLSPYTIPFQQGGPDHLFRDGAAFDSVLDLYIFDRALRLHVLDALERVEVAVRTALTDHMSLSHGGPHWYIDASHFRDPKRHTSFLKIVHDTCKAQLEGAAEVNEDTLDFKSALEHYLTTYDTPELPPSWLMVETLTLGQLDNLIRNLGRRADKTAVAAALGLTAPVLESWLRTYVRVRNVCAHHGRLWNVGLGVYPAIPTSPKVSWLADRGTLTDRSRRRFYPVLISLQVVLNTIAPSSTWAQRLSDLLDAHPGVPLAGMGIPEGWRDDTFWARHLAP